MTTDPLSELRGCTRIDGSATGEGGEPGQFFIESKKILATSKRDDYRRMIQDEEPCVRVMGALGIALSHRNDLRLLEELYHDGAPLEWCPFGCRIEIKTTGEIRFSSLDWAA